MRVLTDTERGIIAKKEIRWIRKGTMKKVNVDYINYTLLFPRTTLCSISKVKDPKLDEATFGLALKSKHDKNNPEVGEIISFVRALNIYKSEQVEQTEQKVIFDVPGILKIIE